MKPKRRKKQTRKRAKAGCRRLIVVKLGAHVVIQGECRDLAAYSDLGGWPAGVTMLEVYREEIDAAAKREPMPRVPASVAPPDGDRMGVRGVRSPARR